MDRVKDKVAIVTGAALGIGRATSLLLAREGAKVALTDLRDDEGKKLAQEITGMKILADALAQVPCLAHVYDCAKPIAHQVDARLVR